MATASAPAAQTLQDVQKARKAVLNKIGELKGMAGGGNEVTKFAEVEALMSDLRLASMHTVFLEFKLATERQVEEQLWQIHVYVNTEYRKMLGKLKAQHQVVVKRKLVKQYAAFLRTAQYFYRGYIQRLWARYEIPELERIAREIKMDGISTTERVDPVSMAVIKPAVVRSCYDTLIHLGDLSRYRYQASHKGHGTDIALTYYGLAHDINPESGYAHHQMGVVFLEEKKHLDIVYHFYRAMVVASPHPNAALNLEVEMKSLIPQQAAPKGRNTPLDPQETFASWFIRLHARFYKGEEFSQHAELEKEVLHRFETTIKTAGTLPLLFKMVMINMCAYSVANTKVSENWTLAGSRSCQYILGLNVRVISILARLLGQELQKCAAQPVVDSSNASSLADPKAPDHLGPILEIILPLLRIYMTWTCVYANDLVRYEEHLEPHIHNMYTAVDQGVAVLYQVFGRSSTQGCPYLLPEDIETIGVIPLRGEGVPIQCRLQYTVARDSRSHNAQTGGPAQKPRAEEAGLGSGKKNPALEDEGRIHGIMMCHAFLRGGSAGQQEQQDTLADIMHNMAVNANDTGLESSNQPMGSYSHARGSSQSGGSRDMTSGSDFKNRDITAPYTGGKAGGGGGRPGEPPLALEQAMENQLQMMLGDFLTPPEAHADSSSHHEANETSYGMHSSTANEVFGAIGSKSPVANSNTNKAIPSLPWNNVWTPEPKRPGQQRQYGIVDWERSPSAGSAAYGAATLSNTALTPGMGSPDDLLSPRDPRSASQLRDQASATEAQARFSGQQGAPAYDAGKRHQEYPGGGRLVGSPMSSAPVRCTGVGNIWGPPAGHGHVSGYASGMSISTFPSTDFSHALSGVPPTNSAPWGTAAATRSPYHAYDNSSGQQQQQQQQQQQEAATGTNTSSDKQQVLLDLLARQAAAPFGP